jgi:Zn-dependent protease
MDNPEIILMIPVLLFSLSFHEFAHALSAKLVGDNTAERAGRLTLNPISHIDPIGTILVPLICLIQMRAGGIPFFIGWAKPVPVNPRNYRRSSDDVIVSGAGPASNFLMVILFTIIFKIFLITGIFDSGIFPPKSISMIFNLMFFFISLNLLLGLFNLLPFPPLDGSHIFYHFLVRPHTRDHIMFKIFEFMERFGRFMLIFLIFFVPDKINPFRIVFGLSLKGIFWFLQI